VRRVLFMKVYVDRDDIIEMLYRADVSSKEKIEEIIMRAPTYQMPNSQYENGYSDGREVQIKVYAAEKEAIRKAINKLDYMLCIINDTGGTIQYSDMNAINKTISVIKNLCKEES
jgi:hypothetical protein